MTRPRNLTCFLLEETNFADSRCLPSISILSKSEATPKRKNVFPMKKEGLWGTGKQTESRENCFHCKNGVKSTRCILSPHSDKEAVHIDLYPRCSHIQSTLVISNSLISNNRLSRSENLVPVETQWATRRQQNIVEKRRNCSLGAKLLFSTIFSIYLLT